jgi:hypothetical protein
MSTMVPSKLCGDLDDLSFSKLTNGVTMGDKSLLEIQINLATGNQHVYDKIIYDAPPKEYSANAKHYARLRELELERSELQKQRSSSCLTRNFGYPVAMLLLLLLTSITVLLVMQNTIELLIGIKALPMSSRVSVCDFASKGNLFTFEFLLAAIYIRNQLAFKVGRVWSGHRNYHYSLFSANISRRILHDANIFENKTQTKKNIAESHHCE